MALTAGLLALLSLVILVGGSAIRSSVEWGETLDSAWAVARWPLGVAFAIGSVSLLFWLAPRRRQPEPSWLAFGAAVSTALWLVLMAALALYIQATDQFGATYGPIAGTIGVLLWTFFTSIALFVGLAFAAQLEAVRAGVPAPRVEREENVSGLRNPAQNARSLHGPYSGVRIPRPKPSNTEVETASTGPPASLSRPSVVAIMLVAAVSLIALPADAKPGDKKPKPGRPAPAGHQKPAKHKVKPAKQRSSPPSAGSGPP